MRRFSVILLAAASLLGFLLAPQYGESWDELKFYKYADEALQAYTNWPTTGEIHITGNTYDNYGPAYVMAVTLGARALGIFLPWIESDLRHLLYFLTFLAGLWAFHQLARRWLGLPAALGATALFAMQPLLWGHAFISPKDIPFLSLFLLTIYSGLRFYDMAGTLGGGEISGHSGRQVGLLTFAWLLSLLMLFLGTPVFHNWLDGMVRAAAGGQDNLVARLATDIHRVAPEVYIQKYFVLFIRLRAVFFILSTLALVLLYRRFAPGVIRLVGALLIPAVLLGITVGVRVLGPLAGLLVAGYALYRHGTRALPSLLLYSFLALVAMYATWPYLWPDPAGHFAESIVVMARYPWRGQVLFNGISYASTDIPRSYLPVLLGIQMTEPVWILFAAGLVLCAVDAARKRPGSLLLLGLTAVWFILPVLAFIALRSPLYDNFRQIFFIIPPVFLVAGLVFDRIRQPLLRVALILLCLLPGLIDGIRLHPYEYAYYNRFVGGEAGAFRRFELDYWGTTYREAAGWLNVRAAPNAPIWVDGPAHLLGLYLRPDLKLYSTYEADRADHYDFTVSTSRYNLDLSSYPEARVVKTISRDGAVLAVIKQP